MSAVPNELPLRDDGKKRSLATAYRLSTHGVAAGDGRRLRFRRFRTASTWATTRQELHRWFVACTAARGGDL